MGLFRFLFRWSLQITGLSIIGYNYGLKPHQQADIYGFYRSVKNTYSAAFQIRQAMNQYKSLIQLKENPEQYNQKLQQINKNTAKRLQLLSRTNQGIYMRLGQFIAKLKQGYPNQLREILQNLNKNPKYQQQQYKYLKNHIENDLKSKTKQIFQQLNTVPIHTDLFSQIYKGQLLENFLDVNLRVVKPYAKYQAKYDYYFIKKAAEYINNFKQKNFPQTQPLFLNLLIENVNKSVNKELNLKLEQQNAQKLKQVISEINKQQNNTKLKTKTRPLPIYIPHIYTKYTQQNIIIQQYCQGNNLNNLSQIKKQNLPLGNVSSDIVNIWNTFLNKNILLQNYSPFNIMVRKSRPNEQGTYQIVLNNFQHINTQKILQQTYRYLWQQFIANKKFTGKNSQQRINSINKFYKNLSSVQFGQILKEYQLFQNLKQISQITNVQLSTYEEVQLLNMQKIQKDVLNKLKQKKLITVPIKNNKLNINNYSNQAYNVLKRAFQIQYKPWNYQSLFNMYREVFKQEQYFGAI